jgi:hypothetical protein
MLLSIVVMFLMFTLDRPPCSAQLHHADRPAGLLSFWSSFDSW